MLNAFASALCAGARLSERNSDR